MANFRNLESKESTVVRWRGKIKPKSDRNAYSLFVTNVFITVNN